MDAEQRMTVTVAPDVSQVVTVLDVIARHAAACAEELSTVSASRELRIVDTGERITDWSGVEIQR